MATILNQSIFNYTTQEMQNDYQTLKNMSAANDDNIIDVDFSEMRDAAPKVKQESQETMNPFEKLKKLGQLKDAGIITEEEFNEKKAELLRSI